jgi:hypothetical protein
MPSTLRAPLSNQIEAVAFVAAKNDNAYGRVMHCLERIFALCRSKHE